MKLCTSLLAVVLSRPERKPDKLMHCRPLFLKLSSQPKHTSLMRHTVLICMCWEHFTGEGLGEGLGMFGEELWESWAPNVEGPGVLGAMLEVTSTAPNPFSKPLKAEQCLNNNLA